MKLVFMGTPAFAVPSLERTVEAGHQVIAVFTQPDRPKGRGQKDAMSPVKEAALRLGLTVHQPERVRRPDVVEQLRAMAPEAMVVVGYGQIIPKTILEIPPQGIINLHASLLPKYRGAAPIQWAIARGETSTGVTTMRINEGLDTGDMLLKWETAIGPEESAVELGGRLAVAGADLLVRTLAELPAIQPQPQDDSQATYAPILKKEDGKIDWTLSASRNLEPDSGLRAVARRLWFSARTAFADLERGGWRSKVATGSVTRCEPQAVCGMRARGIDRVAGGSVGREEENAGCGVYERVSTEWCW